MSPHWSDVEVIPTCRCGRPAEYFTINPDTGRLHAYVEVTRQGTVPVALAWCSDHQVEGPKGCVRKINAPPPAPPERPPARAELTVWEPQRNA